MNDRIKLATAMGWVHTYDEKPAGMIMDPPDGWWRDTDGGWSVTLDFDPFTSADDDYAVLEWMRGKYAGNEDDTPWDSEWFGFKDSLYQSIDYELGDYARAALKVLE